MSHSEPDLPEYVPAARAIEMLGVKRQTLYAYVARGWIRALAQPGSHQKLYSRDDLERVRIRSRARSGHGPVAAAALRWGDPVFGSSITHITESGPRYRNHLASDLAEAGYSFEATADLLWTGQLKERQGGWRFDPPPPAFQQAIGELVRNFPDLLPRDLMAMIVQLLAAAQQGNPEQELGSLNAAGRQMIQVLAGSFAHLLKNEIVFPNPGESVAHLLSRALHLPADKQSLLEMALIVCADHELAPASFASRIAASTGANLHSCISAGIAAFDGPLTGLGADRVEDLILSARSEAQLYDTILTAREQGRQLPGFHHPLYPKGDPRAVCLLNSIARMPAPDPAAKTLLNFIGESAKNLQLVPALPVGLVAVQLALGLPVRTAGSLFLLGRIAGCIAHVQEQRLDGFLLRPRAEYLR